MMKFKNLLALFLLAITIYSCDDNNFFNDPFADVDHVALAVSDNDSIVKFLKGHYYDSSEDILKPLTSSATSLYDDSAKLKTIDITENDIDYKLYVYVTSEGSDPNQKGSPTFVDSVFVKYEGKTFSGTSFSTSNFDQNNRIWFNLTSVVRGWSFGFSEIKPGQLKTEPNGDPFNGPITYLNPGKAYIFIPSGLAYPSSSIQNRTNTLVDDIIFFKVELYDFVENTDQDNDGVPSILEDVNENNSVSDDDTDEDGIPNFFDTDDDGDGILTKDEDANGDGDPTNDFSDSNNPSLPDYLNPDIR